MKCSLLVATAALIAGCGPGNPPAATSSTAGSGGGAAGSTSAGAGGSAPGCPACAPPKQVGELQSDKLAEVSGIAAGQGNPGLFYVHNDSGDKARFFAINAAGKTIATFDVLTGAEAVDWEDIAVGPCPAGRCVYLADTGDNLKERSSSVIYRVTEPVPAADASLPAEAFPFTYPDGARDVETLFVHPVTGAVTLVSKTFGPSEIYELPAAAPGESVVAVKVGTITLPIEPALVTGGDVRPDGRGVLLRTYADAYYFPLAEGSTVAASLMGQACPVPLAVEPQGEGVGWLADGTGYLSVSEGQQAAIHLVTCSLP